MVRGVGRAGQNEAARGWDCRLARLAVALLALCAGLVVSLWSPAHAVEAIIVKPEQEKIDITALGELYEGRGDRLPDRRLAVADHGQDRHPGRVPDAGQQVGQVSAPGGQERLGQQDFAG